MNALMHRGQLGWALQTFRRDAMPALLDGLVLLEGTGFIDTPGGLSAHDKCSEVQKALGVLANRAADTADSKLLKSMHNFSMNT